MMKSFKVSLSSCVKRAEIPHVIPLLEEVVRKVHAISTKTLLFLKLHCLFKYRMNPRIDFSTIINEVTIFAIMKVIAGDRDDPHGNLAEANLVLRNELIRFYDEHFADLDSNTSFNSFGYKNLSQILKYETKKIVVMFENNIEANFTKHVQRFVNVRL